MVTLLISLFSPTVLSVSGAGDYFLKLYILWKISPRNTVGIKIEKTLHRDVHQRVAKIS